MCGDQAGPCLCRSLCRTQEQLKKSVSCHSANTQEWGCVAAATWRVKRKGWGRSEGCRRGSRIIPLAVVLCSCFVGSFDFCQVFMACLLHTWCFLGNKSKLLKSLGFEGPLGGPVGLSAQLLISTQVMISGLWAGGLHHAGCGTCLRLPLSLSLAKP